jgi:hypothetical protein
MSSCTECHWDGHSSWNCPRTKDDTSLSDHTQTEEELREKLVIMLDMDKEKPTVDELYDFISSYTAQACEQREREAEAQIILKVKGLIKTEMFYEPRQRANIIVPIIDETELDKLQLPQPGRDINVPGKDDKASYNPFPEHKDIGQTFKASDRKKSGRGNKFNGQHND